jgi:hypothetical protein
MEGGSLYAILERFGITFASGEQIVSPLPQSLWSPSGSTWRLVPRF